jgi:hypothetical protein
MAEGPYQAGPTAHPLHCSHGSTGLPICDNIFRVIRLKGLELSAPVTGSPLTDTAGVVSLTGRPPFNSRNIPGTHFF